VISFAVPSNVARAVMEQLIIHGEVRRDRLGVISQDLTPDLAEAFDLDRAGGAVITGAEPGSPAEHAGLEPGDVIVEVNGEQIESARDLRNIVGLVETGSELEIRFYREGHELSVMAIVQPKQQAALSVEEAVPQLGGVVFRDITPDLPVYGHVRGVVAADVASDSPAWSLGLRAGDIVTDVNQSPVGSVDEFNEALEALMSAPGAIVFYLIRGDTRLIAEIQ